MEVWSIQGTWDKLQEKDQGKRKGTYTTVCQDYLDPLLRIPIAAKIWEARCDSHKYAKERVETLRI